MNVESVGTSKLQLMLGTVTTNKVSVQNGLKQGTKLTAADVTAQLPKDVAEMLTGKAGQTVANLDKLQTSLGTLKLSGKKTYLDSSAKQYHYEFTVSPEHFATDNRAVSYGNALTLFVNANLVPSSGTSTSTDNSWIQDK